MDGTAEATTAFDSVAADAADVVRVSAGAEDACCGGSTVTGGAAATAGAEGADAVATFSDGVDVSYFDVFVGGAITAFSASASDFCAGASDCGVVSLRISFAAVPGSVLPGSTLAGG